ncbi:MAG: phosphatase PAP2 family protein [Vicinamibacterales bacterium]
MPKAAPVLLALVVTVLVVAAVSMAPYFAGDVAVARAVQAAWPFPGLTALLIPTVLAPGKFVTMAIALVACWVLGGWRGAALVAVAIAIEQLGGEASKALAHRPRPSPDLIAVVGHPSGFGFPSTFVTFYAVTFGGAAVVAWRAASSPSRTAVIGVSALMIVLAWLARVVPGAHWPSDVVLTTVVCLAWLWAGARLVLPRRRGAAPARRFS